LARDGRTPVLLVHRLGSGTICRGQPLRLGGMPWRLQVPLVHASTAAVVALSLASLCQVALADTMDINVVLYKDPNCFERADDMVLLDQGCYANRFDNMTKAFQLKVVVFDEKPKIDLREYINNCYEAFLFKPARTLEGGRCERFVGGFYVQTSLRLRSTTCEGYSCSPISVAVQRFYSEEGCTGVVVENNNYPLQSECMRFSNGTQAFKLGDTDNNITQVDYLGNDGCNGVLQRSYSMIDGNCYSLYSDSSPKSFIWMVEKGKAFTSAAATKRRSLHLVATSAWAICMALAAATAAVRQ